MPSQAPQAGEIPSLLRAHPFLRALPEVALDRLLSNGARREAEMGSVLLRQGEASDSAMLLLVGAVEVVAETVSGEIRLARVDAPALLGEIGVIAALPRTATVRALENVRYLNIGKEVFNSLADESP